MSRIDPTVRRGDIFYVYGTEATGSEQRGDRPAIIVGNDIGNKHSPVVEIVYLTTRQKTRLPTHIKISTALRPSTALCEQIYSVCKSRLGQHIGHVTEQEMDDINKALAISVGIRENARGGGALKMQITMKTPFGEMEFDLPKDKAADLFQRAFQYAAQPEEEKSGGGASLPEQEPGASPGLPDFEQHDDAVLEGDDSQEAATQPERPRSRVERMFEGFHPSRPAEQTSDEPEEYKGFLLIKCEHCGKLRGFCTKTPISKTTCDCGHAIELHDLKALHLECGKCGGKFTYKTNADTEELEYPCLQCGSPVDMVLNRRGTTYVTVN